MTQTSLIRTNNHLPPVIPQNQPLSIDDLPQLPKNIKDLLQYLFQINVSSNEQGYITPSKPQNHKTTQIKSQNQIFCSAFKRLSQIQQRQYLKQMMAGIKNRDNKINKGSGFDRNQQEYYCGMRLPSSCLQIWNMVSMKLNKKRRTIRILSQGKIIDIYLREYLVRKSKVHPLCFVLQNISFSINKQYNYHIRFQQKDAKLYSYVEQQVKELIVEVHIQAILKQIDQEQSMKQALSKSRGVIYMFLTKKNVGKFDQLANRQVLTNRKIPAQEINQGLSKEMYREMVSQRYYSIQINQKDNTLYRAKYIIQQHQLSILSNFIEAYKNNHSMITNLRVLQNMQTNEKKYRAFYQKIIWNQQIFGQTLISSQSKITQQDFNKNNIRVTLLNIDHEDNNNFIQFIEMQAGHTNGKPVINLFAKFTGEIMFQFGAVQAYLSKLIYVFQNAKKTVITSTKSSKYPTIDTEGRPQVENMERVSQEGNRLSLLNSQGQKPINYLKYNYPLYPTKQKIGKIMKTHFLWNDWRRAQKGGLICRNKQLVQKQKQLFKIVLKKFGQTLISGKNIINFSLPVIIFKKESHLQSLAKTYLYSPIFAQKAAKTANPAERMKLSVVFMITQNALSINMEKPFNPILGETYQGWIDGCPIYLQQISHHPPISAYYIEGRGYKKYGSIEPKISVGLNNASGYSIYPHYVEFEDGSKIQYICAKIMIGGLLVGDRTFNFGDKIYAYDRKNRYFASCKFGPVQTGIFSSSNQPEDYFHGFIYEVTAQFQQYFDSEKGNKPHPEKEHIIRSVSKFDGIWNSSININGEQVLNFQTDLPYEFVPESVPLLSDSKYRQDLTQLQLGNLQASQTAKQQMEQIQRNDRKLRQKYAQ